jgi:phosphoesterase RecJ-like protein
MTLDTQSTMNYPESLPIKETILRASSIITNIHRSPDADSVASARTIYELGQQLGKKVSIIIPRPLPDEFQFLIQDTPLVVAEYGKFDFSVYDLAILVDSPALQQLDYGSPIQPDIPTVIIDHHQPVSLRAGTILNDPTAASTTFVLYRLLKDIGAEITPTVATLLYAGIHGDTNDFMAVEADSRTFKTVGELLDLGADRMGVIRHVFHALDIRFVRCMGNLAAQLELDPAGFSWAAMNNQEFSSLGSLSGVKGIAANTFLNLIKGAKFGFFIVEVTKGTCSVSFRSEGEIDVSRLAASFGGGGHPHSAAALVTGEFSAVVNKVLEMARASTKR